MWKNDVYRAANYPIIEQLTEKTFGRGCVVFVVSKKIAEHFTRFTRNKWANFLLKTWQEQQEDKSTDDIGYLESRIFAELPNNPLSPKLADYALSKMNSTSMEVTMF